jgi:hypothetical protein
MRAALTTIVLLAAIATVSLVTSPNKAAKYWMVSAETRLCCDNHTLVHWQNECVYIGRGRCRLQSYDMNQGCDANCSDFGEQVDCVNCYR